MKLTKKLISCFLVVLLVVSSLPMTVFASLDSVDGLDSLGDANSTALMETIEEYEAMMDGTVYTNMSAAYEAYVDANEAYDAYVYGEATIDLSTYQTTLETAMAAMTEWSYNGISSATGTWPEDSSTIVTEEVYSNLLYCGSADTDFVSASTDTSGSDKQMDLTVRFTPATMLYDGITTPKLPVMAVMSGDSGKNRYVYSVVLTDDDSNSLSLVDAAWNGAATSGTNWDFSWTRYNSSTGARVGTSSASSSYAAQVSQKKTFANKSLPEGDSNIIQYNKTFADGVYLKEITPTFLMYAGSTSTFTNTDIIQGGASSQKIYVINYKAALDAIASNKSKLALNTGNYRQGGAASVVAAFDTITSIDPSTYFNSTTNDYTGCANVIKAGVEGMAVTATADSTNYAALRTAIQTTNATFNSTSSDKYTTTTWNAFSNAYIQAQTLMANLTVTGYSTKADDALTKATTLNTTFAALEVNFDPADATALVNAIDDASYAINYESLFTADSYSASNLATNIPAAKVAVWGAEASYRDEASLVDSSQQNIVDAWADTINEGIAKLVISKDAAVGSAKGYSMNSIIEYAGTLTAADYSNYSDVIDAIAVANKFEAAVVTASTDTTKTTLVQDKVAEYQNAVRNILIAINALKASFAKMPDGQVANTKTNTLVFDCGSDNDDEDGKCYRVEYEYPTELVMFRTKHTQANLKLTDATISFTESKDNESKLKAGYLDSININDTDFTGEVPEISSAKDDEDHSISTPSSYPGCVENSVTVNSLSYKLRIGVNGYITGTGMYGVKMSNADYGYGLDLSGNTVTSSTFDFSNSLANTSGTSSGATGPKGSLVAINGTTTVSASTSMTIPAANSTTRPVLVTASYDSNFSAIVRWSYPGIANRVYYGYTLNGTSYNQTIRIIDVSGLIDLINEYSAKEAGNYTTSSWANFTSVLKAASADMNYGEMTYEKILAECQTRYDNLLAANDALVEAASNSTIVNALNDAATIVNAVNSGEARYSSDSYKAFTDARTTALTAVNGTYSSSACLDLPKTEYQSKIDEIANALLSAIESLVKMANFTNLISAASTKLEDRTYTVDALKEFAELLDSLTYLNLSESDKDATDETAQSAIDTETTTILNAIEDLEAEYVVDTSVAKAKETELLAMYKDPDAWDGLEDVKELFRNFISEENLYKAVTVYGATVYGVNATQKQLDALVTEAGSVPTHQKYTVTVVDVDGNETTTTHNYGDYINIGSDGVVYDIDAENISADRVAWYYSYKSNTSENIEKYYTTSRNIKFVVKGNTTLRTVPETGNDNYYKVTYVSSLNTNKVLAVDYISAADGKVASIPAQPTMAYYESKGYTLDGSAFTTDTVITSDVTVVANYEVSDIKTYTIRYTDSDVEWVATETEYEYNEEVTMTRDDAIYWAQFDNEEKFDMWCNGEADENGESLYRIVYYGDTYTFRVHEDAYIVSLSQDDFKFDVQNGLANEDIAKTPTVTTDEELVYASNKISMISTFAMPDDCTFVEAGLIVTLGETTGLTLNQVDNTSVYRLKSSQRTYANQYVISIASGKMTNGQQITGIAYVIYKDAEGNDQIVYGNENTFTYQA